MDKPHDLGAHTYSPKVLGHHLRIYHWQASQAFIHTGRPIPSPAGHLKLSACQPLRAARRPLACSLTHQRCPFACTTPRGPCATGDTQGATKESVARTAFTRPRQTAHSPHRYRVRPQPGQRAASQQNQIVKVVTPLSRAKARFSYKSEAIPATALKQICWKGEHEYPMIELC